MDNRVASHDVIDPRISSPFIFSSNKCLSSKSCPSVRQVECFKMQRNICRPFRYTPGFADRSLVTICRPISPVVILESAAVNLASNESSCPGLFRTSDQMLLLSASTIQLKAKSGAPEAETIVFTYRKCPSTKARHGR